MKLLCTSDIHRNAAIAGNILQTIENENIDVFINAGDFLDNQFAYEFFKKLKVRSFIVRGNWDSGMDYNSKSVTVGDGVFRYGEYSFLCVGGGRPFGVDETLDAVKDVDGEKLVMITHYPPYGILDSAWSNAHAGFMEYRKFLSVKNPCMHVFGHIHESNGCEMAGKTLAINCALTDHGMGRGYIVDLPDKNIKVVNLNERKHYTPFKVQSTISRIIGKRK